MGEEKVLAQRDRLSKALQTGIVYLETECFCKKNCTLSLSLTIAQCSSVLWGVRSGALLFPHSPQQRLSRTLRAKPDQIQQSDRGLCLRQQR